MRNRLEISLMLLFVAISSNAQENNLNGQVQESRVFQKSSIKVIQSRYLDKNGEKIS